MPEILRYHAPTFTPATPYPWQDDAACLDEDPEIFFPDPGDTQSALAAAECCEICPVAKQCLQYALDNHIEYGIFGGVSERGRRKLDRAPDETRQVNRKKVASMTGKNMTTLEISEALGISRRQVMRLRSKKVTS